MFTGSTRAEMASSRRGADDRAAQGWSGFDPITSCESSAMKSRVDPKSPG